MRAIVSIITLPLLAALLLFLVPEKLKTVKGIMALLISIITGYLTIVIFGFNDQVGTLNEVFGKSALLVFGFDPTRDAGKYLTFNCDNLSKLITLFISLFAILVLLYSIIYVKTKHIKNYYPYFLITLGCSYGAVLSDNLLLFPYILGNTGYYSL